MLPSRGFRAQHSAPRRAHGRWAPNPRQDMQRPDNTAAFKGAADWEGFMGRWGRASGEKFLDWLSAPSHARWLDGGCGTGAFSGLIAKRCAPKSISGIDPSGAQ